MVWVFRVFHVFLSFIINLRFFFRDVFSWLPRIYLFGILFLFFRFFLIHIVRFCCLSLGQPSQKIHWFWVTQSQILKFFFIDFMHFNQVLFDETFEIGERILEILESVSLFKGIFDPVNYFFFIQVFFFCGIMVFPEFYQDFITFLKNWCHISIILLNYSQQISTQ